MNSPIHNLLKAIAALLMTGLAPAFAATEGGATDCRAFDLRSHPASMQLDIQATDRNGSQRRLKATMYSSPTTDKKVRLSLRLTAPPDLAGSAYLIQERSTEGASDTVYSYLPASGRTRRISGAGGEVAIWGTDFSYQDLLNIRGTLQDSAVEQDFDQTIDGREVYVYRIQPGDDSDSPYRRIENYVDKQTCLLLRARMFGGDGRVAKRLVAPYAEVQEIDDLVVPGSMTMHSPAAGTHTRMTLSDIQLGERPPERLFKPDSFWR